MKSKPRAPFWNLRLPSERVSTKLGQGEVIGRLICPADDSGFTDDWITWGREKWGVSSACLYHVTSCCGEGRNILSARVPRCGTVCVLFRSDVLINFSPFLVSRFYGISGLTSVGWRDFYEGLLSTFTHQHIRRNSGGHMKKKCCLQW